jgi:hypothetical protein
VAPGQNLILVGPVTIEKPCYDGYVISMRPNLVREDGTVPPTDVIHLHHGVFLNASAPRGTEQRFFATGEEKTKLRLPPGYGLPVRGSDTWLMNYMVHNQTPVPDNVWMTYDIDYVPRNSALGRRIVPVEPVWMDVQNGGAYPVFDVRRGTGRHARFTYPDQARHPYGAGRPKNVWTVPRDGTLVAGAGHVHPGGLWTDLDLLRRHRAKRIFRSRAHYWDPNGPVSWDMAMGATLPNWRVSLHRGDRLRVSATYETRRASWYESMGIDLLYMAGPRRAGRNPFHQRVPTGGTITHGRLAENFNHGGGAGGLPDPSKLPSGQTLSNRAAIEGFTYTPGNLGTAGFLGNPPAVPQGQGLRFDNLDWGEQILHTITACRLPCNKSTGVSYPLANGSGGFDSGDLGYGPTGLTAAANRSDWTTPANLKPGTYTYFCRIHPYMRGAFRVTPK